LTLWSISPIFCERLLHAQIPKVQKRQSSCQSFFALLGSALAKAAHRPMMKLTPGRQRDPFLDFRFHSRIRLRCHPAQESPSIRVYPQRPSSWPSAARPSPRRMSCPSLTPSSSSTWSRRISGLNKVCFLIASRK